MSEFKEPNITINGHKLSIGQAMTVRVALESFFFDIKSNGLGDDEQAQKMCEAYCERVKEIRRMIFSKEAQ